jgi:Domain of unknown function (DUF4440)
MTPRNLAVLLGTAFFSAAAGFAAKAAIGNGTEEAKQAIWAKEMAIYEGRSRGMIDFYLANASPNFLAWTAGTSAPFRIDALRAGQAAMRGRAQEIIKTSFRDFSLSGDTAIIYYQNHRTRLPDGTAVDQIYDNIHVWQKTDGEWKVLASMSRPMGPASVAQPSP